MKKSILLLLVLTVLCTACGKKTYTHDDVYSSSEILENVKEDTASISEIWLPDLRDRIESGIKMGEKTSCIYAKVIDTKYYIKKVVLEKDINSVMGARIYTVDITEIDPKYNLLNLKKGDRISVAYISNSWHSMGHLGLRFPYDYDEIIKESGETINLGSETYYRMWLDKKYGYVRIRDSNALPFLRDGEEWAFTLYKPWEDQEYYIMRYCYPVTNVEQAVRDNPVASGCEMWKYALPQLVKIIEDDLKAEQTSSEDKTEASMTDSKNDTDK